MSPDDFRDRFKARHAAGKKPRINWKKELINERGKVIEEAICLLKCQMRGKPKSWHAGYFSAITQLEIMKNKKQ